MGKFSSQEIENQYNLIRMLFAEPEKYKMLLMRLRNIEYIPMEFKKIWGRKYYLMNKLLIRYTKRLIIKN